MTIRPAAGPLMVICELLMNVQTSPPMTAVQMPAMGGKLLALAMARHRGNAMRKTRKPARASKRRLPSKPRFVAGASWGLVSATKIPFGWQEAGGGESPREEFKGGRVSQKESKSGADAFDAAESGKTRQEIEQRPQRRL